MRAALLSASACVCVLVACGSDPAGDEVGSQTGTGDSDGDSSDAETTGAETTDTGTTDTDTGTDTTGTDTTGTDPFVHEFHTFVTDDGYLAFESNLPPQRADCLEIVQADVPCDDADDDGLVDAWEDAVLDRLRPLRRMDEEESLFADASAMIGDVGRVFPAPPDHVRIFVMLGYSRDYGSCGGLSSHNGDSERVALDLVAEPAGGVGGVRVVQVYTAAHEGTVTDHSEVFPDASLDQIVVEDDPQRLEPRWVVFPSADKHATYATVDICENISFIPCFDEDCAPDDVMDPAAFDLLPAVVNAGEEAAPRVTDLAVVGFPGDEAWVDQDFCGGLGGNGCSSSVRSKLVVDPF